MSAGTLLYLERKRNLSLWCYFSENNNKWSDYAWLMWSIWTIKSNSCCCKHVNCKASVFLKQLGHDWFEKESSQIKFKSWTIIIWPICWCEHGDDRLICSLGWGRMANVFYKNRDNNVVCVFLINPINLPLNSELYFLVWVQYQDHSYYDVLQYNLLFVLSMGDLTKKAR